MLLKFIIYLIISIKLLFSSATFANNINGIIHIRPFEQFSSLKKISSLSSQFEKQKAIESKKRNALKSKKEQDYKFLNDYKKFIDSAEKDSQPLTIYIDNKMIHYLEFRNNLLEYNGGVPFKNGKKICGKGEEGFSLSGFKIYKKEKNGVYKLNLGNLLNQYMVEINTTKNQCFYKTNGIKKINTCYFDTDSYTSEGNKQYYDMLRICKSYYKTQERNY